jgi:two-component system, chemotaxis family, protein-glutamate methylesterase/glutaminase
MGKVRVLVVEDSLTVRRRLIEVLATDPSFEVVGEAADGRAAIELCKRLRPDIVTLDMMLPVMTGLAATEYIMAHLPTPILVVSSSFNRGEMFKTYDALAAGAVDVIEKPTGLEAPGVWEREFLSAVRVVSRVKVITHHRSRGAGSSPPHASPSSRPPAEQRSQPRGQLELALIGVSTGGPSALVTVLRALPSDFPAPVLIVLHLAAAFATAFADWLADQSGREVRYATDGEPLASLAGRVRLAPPDRHLVIAAGRLALNRDPERHSCRPSVDVLFESAARELGPVTLACLLTGMGRDGAAGLLELRRAGALTIAQDEASSVVYGMPREAAQLGAATHVTSLAQIGPLLAASFRARGATP